MQGIEICPISDPVPIIYSKSKFHLILTDTDSCDLAFLAQLKSVLTLLVPHWLLLSGKGLRHLFSCSAALPRWAAGCFFWSLSIHYVTDSSNSLSATSEWWQWRLQYPIIYLPCLLMRRFPVTLGSPVLITLLTGFLSFSVAFRQKCVQSQKLWMPSFLNCQKSARYFLPIDPWV